MYIAIAREKYIAPYNSINNTIIIAI